ncbi:helix-turn-helix domain-containing protein [Halobacterium jilantaiense]|nr:hypothetical protein [Halobacterium jilantaiense]
MTVVEDVLSPAQYEAWSACRAPGEMPVRMFARETERSEGTVGNHLRRAEDKLAAAADAFAAVAEPVDFLEERDARSTSWERAAPLAPATEIRQLNSHAWLLQLPDGSPHVTALLRRQGSYQGWCDCNGWEYRDDPASPCAHLCTLRQGAFAHVETAEGERLQVTEASATREPVTDGGEFVKPAAGADGREFGRPEGQL